MSSLEAVVSIDPQKLRKLYGFTLSEPGLFIIDTRNPEASILSGLVDELSQVTLGSWAIGHELMMRLGNTGRHITLTSFPLSESSWRFYPEELKVECVVTPVITKYVGLFVDDAEGERKTVALKESFRDRNFMLVSLAHELIHALHHLENGGLPLQGPIKHPRYTRIEDEVTIGSTRNIESLRKLTENAFREALGTPLRCGHKLGVGSISEFILSWIGAIEELKEYVRNCELDPWDYLVAISASSKLYHNDVTEFLFHELDKELRQRQLARLELREEQQDLFTEYYCDNQNLEALVRVLERCSFIPNQRLLSRAIDNNNYCLVEYLLREHNLVPSQMDLLVAIKCHNHAVTRLLLKKYDRPVSEEHINAAIETNDLQMVGCILEKIATLAVSCVLSILTCQQDVAFRVMLERFGVPTEMITSLGAMGALADAADGDGNMGRRRGVFVRRGDRL